MIFQGDAMPHAEDSLADDFWCCFIEGRHDGE